jgi:hypothetical protein
MYYYTHAIPGIFQSFVTGGSDTDGLSGNFSTGHTGADFIFTGDQDNANESRTISYSSGTRSRSVTSIVMSVSHDFYTQTAFPGSPFVSQTTTTESLGAAGSSTGVDSWSYTDFNTETYAFSAGWTGTAGSSTTQLTASTGATRVQIMLTVSRTASGTTLVPLFAVSHATVQRWHVARQHPRWFTGAANQLLPRAVALAYAATAGSSSPLVSPLAAGSNSYLSDLSIGTQATTLELATGSITYKTYWTMFTGRSVGSTRSVRPSLTAQRREFYPSAFIFGTALGAGLSAAPAVGTSSLVTPVAHNLYSISVWTRPVLVGQTRFAWKHTSGSWVLHGTSSSGTSTSSFSVSLQVTGSASTRTAQGHTITDEAATFLAEAITTAVLGPLVPVTLNGMHLLSVGSQTAGSGTHGMYTGRASAAASSASHSFSVSSSSESSVGTGADFPATYAASALPFAAAWPAMTVETSTWTISPPVDNVAGTPPGGIPPFFTNRKWNEAGRADPVAVLE